MASKGKGSGWPVNIATAMNRIGFALKTFLASGSTNFSVEVVKLDDGRYVRVAFELVDESEFNRVLDGELTRRLESETAEDWDG